MNGASERLKRRLFVVAGCIALAIGAVGVVVPILPTTPFLLLAAACFTRGSQRIYGALLRNRLVGSYLRGYLEGGGMSLKAKIWTLVLLCAAMAVTAITLTDSTAVRIILAVVLIGVTAHIVAIKTLRKV